MSGGDLLHIAHSPDIADIVVCSANTYARDAFSDISYYFTPFNLVGLRVCDIVVRLSIGTMNVVLCCACAASVVFLPAIAYTAQHTVVRFSLNKFRMFARSLELIILFH